MQTQARLPRFRRHRFHRLEFVLQPRDLEIVRVVAQHRFISSNDLCLLVGSSTQGILRRLQRLFHNGYLDRPRSQKSFGNAPMVYALGAKGAELLARETGERPSMDWSEKNRQLGAPFLEHALMISRLQAALRAAVRDTGDVVLERWLPDGAVRDAVTVSGEHGNERIPVAPDAVFTLKLLKEPAGRNRVTACVESDRGTTTTARFFIKTQGYWHWWRSGRAEESLGVKNFLVVTVTRSEERARNLSAAVASLDAPRHRGLRMFLFGCEHEYADGKFRAVLGPIWGSPADGQWYSLLE